MTEARLNRRPRIALVSTREIDEASMAGRLITARAIRAALQDWSELSLHRLPSVLTDPSVPRTLGAALASLVSLARQPILPLQCAIFCNPGDLKCLIDQLPADLDAVYLDGVRSYAFLVALRRRRPNLRIVVDFDDLMSRRMYLLLEANEYLSPGYLTKRLPLPLRRLMTFQPVGKLIVLFERGSLKRVERDICQIADAVSLVSASDAALLERFTPERRADIAVIPPPSQTAVAPTPFETPGRFVFIGSDALTQNRLTIDYLVGLWRRFAIATPLVIYGLRSRELSLPMAVTTAGYVDRIQDVYDGRSVLLTPSLIGGGIKTKVLEAFAYGAPVIGNALTFEASPLADYPLCIEDEAELVALLRAPGQRAGLFDTAIAIGRDYIRRAHDVETFNGRWRLLMVPGAGE
jgi:glycosyltransferase involved in cell wall biosynthesis